jgi:hypothetical protein
MDGCDASDATASNTLKNKSLTHWTLYSEMDTFSFGAKPIR